MKYCILAAGKGTRVSSVVEGLHKALLPVENKPAISQILDARPEDAEIVIAVGHLKEQVMTYLQSIYPELNFNFVTVDNYDKPGSGPGYSLLCCEKYLQERFIFTSVDTLPNTSYCNLNYNWIGVSDIKDNHKGAYYIPSKSSKAFIGAAGIDDYKSFWAALKESKTTSYYQVTDALEKLKDVCYIDFPNWEDIGDEESYKKTCEKHELLVLPKKDQTLLIDNKQVIKYWSNPAEAKNFADRSKIIEYTPKVTLINTNMCTYEYVPGTLISDIKEANVLSYILHNHFRECRDQEYLSLTDLEQMYRLKTKRRLDLIKDLPIMKVTKVNDISIKDIIKFIDWQDIYRKSKGYRFHGDFQPENIIVHDATRYDPYTLLDWRSNFGESLEIGDMYYDLGKLLHGLIVSGDLMKFEKYDVNVFKSGTHAEISWLMKSNLVDFIEVLKKFCMDRKLSFNNVRRISAIHFLNIASLYKGWNNNKYTNFLVLLGQYELARINDNSI